MNLEIISQTKVVGGWHKRYTFDSATLNSKTRFAVFLPPNASAETPVPVIYWLSGLTCTDENFMQKAGAFRAAAELGIAIVAPDTSPRGEDVPDDADSAYDFGHGAGFYVNATQTPWNKHYHMYDFIVRELPQLIEENFPVTDKRAISGHSMGGHGALVVALRNPERYVSVSAFSPISCPTKVPWGHKAFSGYLGNNRDEWEQYDSCRLMGQYQGKGVPALVDQGDRDEFLYTQLRADLLGKAVLESGYPLELRIQPGYDHSYYFIASFIEDHLRFHVQNGLKS